MDREKDHLTHPVKDVAASIKWCKIITLGNAHVGKTSIIKNFCDAGFSDSYQATVGVDYGFRIHSEDDTETYVNIWDFSGQNEYCDVRNELYEETKAVFLVYDVTTRATFEDLDSWLREFQKYCETKAKIAVVANKIDCNQKRVVKKEEGMKWAKNHNAKYFETSAATGQGIKELFGTLISIANSTE
ncbi:DnaJ-like protein subfamily C member 27 [Trichoplax sp. H2]|nr:DnaJ-like protein subfamily C member 27 [Trichoplax sp. H2]|eukprot:RDD40681.1 DnaJ-like protein subfamily C member 27 [Trichoplax sp. H2]